MIHIENLSKKYDKIIALDNLNFEVKKGEVFGFVGPNGAGKTTAMSILATLISPTSGKAYIGDFNVEKSPYQVRKLIGYLPDFFGVYDNLRADEYLNFYGAAYGINSARRKKIIPELLALVKLDHKSDAYVDTLSRGMKQRLGLARCLIHDPEVLILDEPASGLDPRSRVEMRDILKELRNRGKTIIISSHILPELAELSDTIGIIEDGRMVTTGSIDEINNRMKGQKQLVIGLANKWEEAGLFLKEMASISLIERNGDYLLAGFNGSESEKIDLLKRLVEAQLPITSFSEKEEDLEEIFLKITKGGEGK